MNNNGQLPKKIASLMRNLSYSPISMGCSGAQVRKYGDFILKIQRHSEESVNEAEFLRFLNGKVFVPEVIAFETLNGADYLLMSQLNGQMLCEDKYLRNPRQLFEKASEVLHSLWSLDATQCRGFMTLERKLNIALCRVESDAVDVSRCNPLLLGKNGRFSSPRKLYEWLIRNKPA